MADIIGMEDNGVDIDEYEKGAAKDLNIATAAELKKKLGEMSIDNEESKKRFKELMSYFLVEQVLLCGRDTKKLRNSKGYWPLVENAELRENCNWAKATWNHLHTAFDTLKTWCAKQTVGQHVFIGAAPILEVC